MKGLDTVALPVQKTVFTELTNGEGENKDSMATVVKRHISTQAQPPSKML